MLGTLVTLGVVAAIWCSGPGSAQHGSDNEVEDMGPAAFTGGQVALVQQDESFGVQIAISYQDDPQSNDDFEVLVSADRITELDPGHQCVNIADPPSDVGAGSNATLQIRYTSEFDKGVNETYYACADITYVRARDFTYRIPCFNATEEEPEPSPAPSPPAPAENEDTGGGGGGLPGGAVAGIAIGAVAAVSLVAVVLFFLYRRDQREKRLAEHRLSNRNVKWDGDVAAASASASRSRTSGGTADSGVSVQLQDLGSR
ncbi:hypothetical protein DL766_000336 [Monosporascus sp. MC13-8B]|uniref:Copper acquisition factor BIM1-like domain-containing protein n=1 Tax=Monosporascus cannonballus TaxID=155416 RepID=A0ABY0HG37_9PEZI|nr:hypothetical protein DL762_001648 [Monosporascus cannonballus]RYP00004.1 hypothetical protein DL763_001134 [Monosporascus cannonballus]RYP39514.1 hypothetical protein DL766_000336 [Monosporascus sp. MC13-8B]